MNLHRVFLAVAALLIAPVAGYAQHYTQTNIDSDLVPIAPNSADAMLQNPWGLARTATSPWWLSDNGTGLSTIINASTNAKQALVVTVQGLNGHTSTPTGIVANGNTGAGGTTAEFQVAGVSARFIFVTEDGTVNQWPGTGTSAPIVVHNEGKAVYKGVTIAEWNSKHYLYAANFKTGKVDVFDTNFAPVSLGKHAFQLDADDNRNEHADGRGRDDDDDFVPFNVQAIGGNVFVAYAKREPGSIDEEHGAGLGFVVVFDGGGNKLARLQHGPWFDAPWGIAMAPGEFGEFSHDILIGNFGSGQIAAFNPVNGEFIGLMKDPSNNTLVIDGLWAIGFGNGGSSGAYNSLFFTAGPNDESDGLFGKLAPIAAELAEVDEP